MSFYRRYVPWAGRLKKRKKEEKKRRKKERKSHLWVFSSRPATRTESVLTEGGCRMADCDRVTTAPGPGPVPNRWHNHCNVPPSSCRARAPRASLRPPATHQVNGCMACISVRLSVSLLIWLSLSLCLSLSLSLSHVNSKEGSLSLSLSNSAGKGEESREGERQRQRIKIILYICIYPS